MAVDTSKFSLQHIYSLIAYHFGKEIADATEFPMLSSVTFIRKVNEALDDITISTGTVERLVLLTPDRRWLRYIKITPEEINNGIVRIDLEGQTPTLLSADDPDNLDWQYESPCTGKGTDPDYAGHDQTIVHPPGYSDLNLAPDSFPKIYLPAETNIPLANYGQIFTNIGGDETFAPPRGNQNRIGGTNEPTTPFVIDMRRVGYGSNDPTDDNYPTTTQTHLFFIDVFLIYALRLLSYTTGVDRTIPFSADQYLNETWTNILGLAAGAGNVSLAASPNQAFFTVDGVQYEVTINEAIYNVTTDNSFTITITEVATAEAWNYGIRPSHTPWQTVATPWNPVIGDNEGTDRWGYLFQGQALYSNRSYYVKVNDFVIRLPDDLHKIKWLWKIPTSTIFRDLPEDPDDEYVTTALADNESYMYSRYDDAYHYFPITETKFTQLKYLESQGYDFRGAGFYIMNGQQLRITPRPTDLKSAIIACIYEAKADNIAEDTSINNFATTYVELPSPAAKAIQYRIISDIYASSRGGGQMEQAAYFYGLYKEELKKLENLYGGRNRQLHDAPDIKQNLDPHRNTRHMGFGYINAYGRGGRRY